jgi:integration host factor subunit beta
MNQLELIEALKEQLGLRKSDAKAAVQLFFDDLAEALIRGDRVEIRGMCTFYVKHYKAYVGRNPKTGAAIQVPPKKQPYFKAGKQLKELVDN